MKATCRATSNIAFVKYWGRIDDTLRLPMNGSISMNLAAASTTTTVEFDPTLSQDQIHPASIPLNDQQAARVFKHIDRIRQLAKINDRAIVATENNFPMGAGIASSASAFAALTVAAASAAGLNLDTRDLTILARQGSGSACRSIPNGFVEWHYGESSEASFAEQIASADHWDLRNLIAIAQTEHKEVGSAEGNARVDSSPFNQTRVDLTKDSLRIIRQAILDRDFTALGEETEREAVRLHVIAMTSQPMILYWNPVTVRIMQAVMDWRKDGLESYFTIDAGANVHVIVQGKDAAAAEARLQALDGVQNVIHSRVGDGAVLIDQHHF